MRMFWTLVGLGNAALGIYHTYGLVEYAAVDNLAGVVYKIFMVSISILGAGIAFNIAND